MKYPWVSVDRTQAEGVYEVYIALAENIHLSVHLGKQEFNGLVADIKRIKDLKQ